MKKKMPDGQMLRFIERMGSDCQIIDLTVALEQEELIFTKNGKIQLKLSSRKEGG